MSPNSNNAISDSQVRAQLACYQVSVNDSQLAQIREYTSLLLQWNRSVGLTTITDRVDIVGRHFGESMFAARLLPVENCRLADVGTGAGFPGLAIKIGVPNTRLVLIESNKKKCAFLAEVVRALRMDDVEIRAERFEQIRSVDLDLNIVVSRAVGEFKHLLHWSESSLAHRGHILLWLGAENATRLARSPGWIWQPAVRIPESQRRFILIGRPTVKS
jgi:16S rRNA (guanine527-N7)-methyltransferase